MAVSLTTSAAQSANSGGCGRCENRPVRFAAISPGLAAGQLICVQLEPPGAAHEQNHAARRQQGEQAVEHFQMIALQIPLVQLAGALTIARS